MEEGKWEDDNKIGGENSEANALVFYLGYVLLQSQIHIFSLGFVVWIWVDLG